MIKTGFKKIQKKTDDSNRVYFGQPELDAVLNNSLKKGHLIIIEQDHPTTIFMSFLRYFVGNAYHKDHECHVYDGSNSEKWKLLIPDRIKQKVDKAAEIQQKSEIAWRYDSMNIKLSNLPVAQDCPFLDLSKTINADTKKDLIKTFTPPMKLRQLYQTISDNLMNCLRDPEDTKLRKIVLTGLPTTFTASQDIDRFMKSLRCLIRSSHVIMTMTIPCFRPEDEKAMRKMVEYSDYYMKINGKMGESYKHFSGSVAILKEIHVGSIDTANRGISVWGIKTKAKRQIRIESLYEDTFGDEQAKEALACGVTMKEKLDF